MIASEQLRAVAGLADGRAAELAAPDDQRVVEQAALLQIGQQGAMALVDLEAQAGAAARRCPCRRMRRGGPSRDDRAGRSGPRAPPAAGRAGSCSANETCPARCRTSRGIDAGSAEMSISSGTLDLHAVGQLVRGDAGRGFGVAIDGVAALVQVGHDIERLAAHRAIHAFRVVREEDRLALRSELDALVASWAGIRFPSTTCRRRVVLAGDEHDERGQVGVVAAQPVREPGAQARTPD